MRSIEIMDKGTLEMAEGFLDYAIALFMLRISPLPCPVAYFTSSRKAMAWLRRNIDLFA